MNKIEFKWDYEVENRLFKLLKKISYGTLKHNKGLKIDLESVFKEFVKFSVSLEKKYHKTSKINFKRHSELAKIQLKEIIEWKSKLKKFVEENKEKDNLQKKLLNNAKFRAREMQGNYYKDFLKSIVAEESEYFIWNTVGDERVRPEHQDRDGEIYSWNEADLLPGEDPGCRCWATVYFPSEEEKKDISN